MFNGFKENNKYKKQKRTINIRKTSAAVCHFNKFLKFSSFASGLLLNSEIKYLNPFRFQLLQSKLKILHLKKKKKLNSAIKTLK